MIEIRNNKTGTVANLISTYNRTSDGKEMFEVFTLSGRAYWLSSHCEVL